MSGQTYYVSFASSSWSFRNLIGKGGATIRGMRSSVGGGCFIQLESDPRNVDASPVVFVVPDDVESGQTIKIPGPTTWILPSGRREPVSSPKVIFRVPSNIPADRVVRVSFVKIVATPNKAEKLIKLVWKKVAMEHQFYAKINVLRHLDTTLEQFDQLQCGPIFVGTRGRNIKKICKSYEGYSSAFLSREGYLTVNGGNQHLVDNLLQQLQSIYDQRMQTTTETPTETPTDTLPDIDPFALISSVTDWDAES